MNYCSLNMMDCNPTLLGSRQILSPLTQLLPLVKSSTSSRSQQHRLSAATTYITRLREFTGFSKPLTLEIFNHLGFYISLDSDDAFPSSRSNLSMELSPSTATMPTRPRELSSVWKFLPRQRRCLPVLEI